MPKELHFSYEGMIASYQLAMLDFIVGVGLKQAKIKLGDLDLSSSLQELPIMGWLKHYITERQNLL